MKILRKIFYNSRNGQGSVTIPAKVIKELHGEFNKTPKRVFIDISLNPKEVRVARDYK
jgi:hypothetical protein